jgi:hypothetical protein
MALYNAGLLRGDECSFKHVARIDMTAPDTLTHSERMLVLRHNVAWEHYLFNFTNFIALLASIEDLVRDVNHVESLFPLPTRWPWMTHSCMPHDVGQIDATTLHTRWYRWREAHDFLYDQ